MPLSSGELKRKLVHVGAGGFALLLRDLTWPEAAAMALGAFLFNWLVLPRLGGRALWRERDHGSGYPIGILLYPLAVLGLVLALREQRWLVAAVWGLLAVGDGMASIVGQAVGGPRLPWNPKKGWAGFAAFVACGGTAAALLAVWTLELPLGVATSPMILTVIAPATLLCALVESLPTTLDDNLTVPLVGGASVALLTRVDLTIFFGDPSWTRRALVGLAVNALIALLAHRARSIDRAGALSAVAIGTLITAGLGLRGLAVMIAFFVVGSAVTKLGYRIKARRGIAQERGGARGWRNAWANGGVPAALALLAGFAAPDDRALFTLAYAAAVATAAADTCSSEVGKAYGRRTFLITTFRPVPPGTEGAVSLEGTAGGLGGALVVALVGAAASLYGPGTLLVVAFAGLIGSLAESALGTVAERRGWLDNDLLNAVNTAIGAAVAVLMVRLRA
ncbi:MAG TPA: DUF92 domain-containing protein [Vicinamibacteria bacterium]|nr:DUF92 domain-containing protein [Vicinamibacteria bacterium]